VGHNPSLAPAKKKRTRRGSDRVARRPQRRARQPLVPRGTPSTCRRTYFRRSTAAESRCPRRWVTG